MFITLSHQANANQNYIDIDSVYLSQNGCQQETKQQHMLARKGWGTYAVGNVNRCSHSGNQYGGS